MAQFGCSKLSRMADDYDRLILAATALRGMESPAEIARYLGVYDQIMTNWKARGIPRAEILDIADKLGCNPFWLRDNKGGMVDYNADAKIKAVVMAMQNMSDYKKDVLVSTSAALTESKNGTSGKE